MQAYVSNSEIRQQHAARAIPVMVERLLADLPEVTPRQIAQLYAEYRAFHRNHRPFRSTPERVQLKPSSPRWGYWQWQDVCDALYRLRDPKLVAKRAAVEELTVIHRAVVNLREHLLARA